MYERAGNRVELGNPGSLSGHFPFKLVSLLGPSWDAYEVIGMPPSADGAAGRL